jgi:hypothetical protein
MFIASDVGPASAVVMTDANHDANHNDVFGFADDIIEEVLGLSSVAMPIPDLDSASGAVGLFYDTGCTPLPSPSSPPAPLPSPLYTLPSLLLGSLLEDPKGFPSLDGCLLQLQ